MRPRLELPELVLEYQVLVTRRRRLQRLGRNDRHGDVRLGAAARVVEGLAGDPVVGEVAVRRPARRLVDDATLLRPVKVGPLVCFERRRVFVGLVSSRLRLLALPACKARSTGQTLRGVRLRLEMWG